MNEVCKSTGLLVEITVEAKVHMEMIHIPINLVHVLVIKSDHKVTFLSF